MAVSDEDVRHVADLARLGLDPARIQSLVQELNGILRHMEVLSAVDPSAYRGLVDPRDSALPLRQDVGPPVPLERAATDFAPRMQDGFFLVPRLATHGDAEIEPAP